MFILQEHISPSLQHQTHNAVLYPFKAYTQVYLKYKRYPIHQPLLCTKYQMCCFVVYLFAKVSRKKQMVLGHIGTLLKKNLDQRTLVLRFKKMIIQQSGNKTWDRSITLLSDVVKNVLIK